MSTHEGGCHCGNLRLTLRLTQTPDQVRLRACGCSVCRANRTRGIYIGAIGETTAGTRAVINTNSLEDRALFNGSPAPTDHNGESVESRLARRAANWTPTVVHR